jgi:hypothetical protein
MLRRLVVFSVLVVAAAVVAAPVGADAGGENKNTVTFPIDCGEFGTFTGTLHGGSGGALILDEGGLSIAMGIKTVDGTIIVKPNPGLARQGKLVECRFTFPGAPELIAFAFFPSASG